MTTSTETSVAVPKDPAVGSVINSVVRVSPEVKAGGYEAKRALAHGIIHVFAPCECVFSANQRGETVLTVCSHPGCQFSWDLAVEALKELERVETRQS